MKINYKPINNSVWNSVHNFVRGSVRNSVHDFFRTSVWVPVFDSVDEFMGSMSQEP